MKKIIKVGLDFAAPIPLHTNYGGPVFEGFEVDLLKWVGEFLKVDVVYEVSIWSKILEALKDDEIDIICSAVTKTPERSSYLEFSDSYLNFSLCVVTKMNSDIHDATKLEKAIVGVRTATEASAYLENRIRSALPKFSESNDELYQWLQKGLVDAIIDDAPIAAAFAKKNSLHISFFLDQPSEYAIALKKGNLELTNAINKSLDAMRRRGEYDKVFDRWFGRQRLF